MDVEAGVGGCASISWCAVGVYGKVQVWMDGIQQDVGGDGGVEVV